MAGHDRSPARATRRAPKRPAGAVTRGAVRAEAVREIERELEAWRDRAIPDPSAPLEAEAVARLVGDCLTSLGLSEAAAASFTVNTVHFYRRKEILDAPEGRTSAARYTVRHLWQAVGARLAGQLALLTLAEARDEMAGRSEGALLAFVAERVLDARARQATRRSAVTLLGAQSLAPKATDSDAPRPLPKPNGRSAGVVPAILVSLPGDAWCVVPASHPARRSAAAARGLAQALVDTLRVTTNPTSDS
jgi:hypothetical protein